MTRGLAVLLAALACGLAPHAALGAAPAGAEARRAFFGDLHLHTSFSTDAVILGGTTTSLDDAYRFARGESVVLLGRRLQRREPLDFLAITDHAEQMGVGRQLQDPATPLGRSDLGRRIRERLGASVDELRQLFRSKAPVAGVDTGPVVRDAWAATLEAAARWNDPGRFTAFVGYEWSSTPEQQNLHRNVIFRGGDAPLPFSAADSERPEDLWSWLEEQRGRGVLALAIPHNANVSNGLMYDLVDSDGRPIDAGYARRRARNEPIGEIVQTKGQSETHPDLSPADPWAEFEIFGTLFDGRKGRVAGSYVREAWGRGLAIAARTGVDPYRFGVVGATDVHSGTSDTHEDLYRGVNAPPGAPLDAEQAKRLLGASADRASVISALATGAAGLAGVWAERNTRESLFDALARRETFATSGTRLVVRFFGGWNLARDLLATPAGVAAAYARGVPMGGELRARPRGARAPVFLAQALQDPNGARLERLQIVKVWLAGERHAEQIHDVRVAGSGGAAELAALWRDPDFDSARPALYYLRALEVPTPRWSTRLAEQAGLAPPAGVAADIQERAWSSPIWYAPPGS
jgi:hypothetical protein